MLADVRVALRNLCNEPGTRSVEPGVLRGMLFGVEPLDATTLVTVTLLVSGVVMAASYFPARRAAGADALASLHYE